MDTILTRDERIDLATRHPWKYEGTYEEQFCKAQDAKTRAALEPDIAHAMAEIKILRDVRNLFVERLITAKSEIDAMRKERDEWRNAHGALNQAGLEYSEEKEADIICLKEQLAEAKDTLLEVLDWSQYPIYDQLGNTRCHCCESPNGEHWIGCLIPKVEAVFKGQRLSRPAAMLKELREIDESGAAQAEDRRMDSLKVVNLENAEETRQYILELEEKLQVAEINLMQSNDMLADTSRQLAISEAGCKALTIALGRIDMAMVPPEQAAIDTKIVGGPVSPYDGVVERVRQMVSRTERLKLYQRHKDGCNCFLFGNGAKCNCGFEEAMK